MVAVNIDTRNLDKPKAWLQEVGIARLGYYADSSAKVFQDLKAIGKAFGMPTTLLIDPNGCELGTLAGPAEWASEDAVKLIEAALGRDADPEKPARLDRGRSGFGKIMRQQDSAGRHQGGFGQVGVLPITRAKRSLISRGTFAPISSRFALVR